jgi:hypothetical protein
MGGGDDVPNATSATVGSNPAHSNLDRWADSALERCKSAIFCAVDCGLNITSGVDERDNSCKGGALRNARMDPLLNVISWGFVSIARVLGRSAWGSPDTCGRAGALTTSRRAYMLANGVDMYVTEGFCKRYLLSYACDSMGRW